MKYKLATAMLAVTAMVVATLTATTVTTTRPAHAAAADPGTWPIDQWGTPQPTDDAVLKWDEQLLSAIRAYPKQTGPTVASRAFGVLFTAIYDAWAAYDPVAKVTQNAGPSQQTTGDTDANKTQAISYAADRTLNDLFPPAQFPSCSPTTTPCPFNTATYQIPDVLLTQQGFDPSYTTLADPSATAATPAAVGNLAAKAVTDFRHNDGSNQANGYVDTTNYKAVNTWNQVNDRWRWQPLCVPLPMPTPPPGGGSCSGKIQNALTPQWGKVIPFSAPITYYYAPGPPKNPDGSYSTADITQALQDTSNLTDFAKVTAEYWADGPGTGFPPGHMMLFAEALSRKNHFSLDTDVKLFFTLGNAEMDAGIVCWYYKYKYDFVRPITAIRVQYAGQNINSWLGPGKGYGLVPAQNWMPYQELNVVTPPFPEYPSGHSTFTAAGATILAAFTGGDTFGVTVTVPAGSSKIDGSGTPAQAITLSFPTFSDAANSAGMSRRYGGIHFYSGDYGGRGLGRQAAQFVWGTAQNYINGYAGKPGS
jgi:PAP2 superfamily